MKLSDALENCYTYSGTLSSVVRQLCFAGIAVLWVLASEDKGQMVKTFSASLFLFVAALFFDLLHYVIATLLWGWFHRHKESQGVSQQLDFDAPACINWVPIFCFWTKALLCVLAYLSLLAAVSKMSFTSSSITALLM